MGVEYPFLAVVASIALFAVVFSTLFLYLHVVAELSRVPVVSGVVNAYTESGYVKVVLVIRHERGEVVELVRVSMYINGEVLVFEPPEFGVKSGAGLALGDVRAESYGLENRKTLLPGSTAYLVVSIPIDYFQSQVGEGGMYHVVLLFDKGTLVLSFTL